MPTVMVVGLVIVFFWCFFFFRVLMGVVVVDDVWWGFGGEQVVEDGGCKALSGVSKSVDGVGVALNGACQLDESLSHDCQLAAQLSRSPGEKTALGMGRLRAAQ